MLLCYSFRVRQTWRPLFGLFARLRVPIPAGATGEFSFAESTLCALIRCPFHPPPPHPRVTAVARKRPRSFCQKSRSFCQKCRWQVTPKHAYTLDPSKSELADYAAVQEECENPSGNELTRNTSGNTRSQSSQLAEPPSTDPGLKSGIMCASEKSGRINGQTFSPNPRTRGKKPPPYLSHVFCPCHRPCGPATRCRSSGATGGCSSSSSSRRRRTT